MKNRPAALFGALLLAAAGPAAAASATVKVTDLSGQAVSGAVVMLTPVGSAASVKPLSDVHITQQGMRFEPAVTVVTPGTRVRFSNLDSFDHHVKGERGQQFSFRLKGYRRSEAGTTPPDSLDMVIQGGKGPITLGCLMHSRMAAGIYIADSPWYGISQTEGMVAIDGLPEGAYAMSVWHPRSLLEQDGVKVQVRPGVNALQARIH